MVHSMQDWEKNVNVRFQYIQRSQYNTEYIFLLKRTKMLNKYKNKYVGTSTASLCDSLNYMIP